MVVVDTAVVAATVAVDMRIVGTSAAGTQADTGHAAVGQVGEPQAGLRILMADSEQAAGG